MAELVTMARPYAKAAFQAATDRNSLELWSEMLSFASAVAMEDKMKVVFDHPALTSEQKASAFADICGDKLNGEARNFVNVLAANGRLSLIPEIASLYEAFKAQKEMSVDVEIESAFELESAQQKMLAEALGKKLDRTVMVSSITNKDLLGGAIIRTQDLVIDASIRGKIIRMAEAINS